MNRTRSAVALSILIVLLVAPNGYSEEDTGFIISLEEEFIKREYWDNQLVKEEVYIDKKSMGDYNIDGTFKRSIDLDYATFDINYKWPIDERFNIDKRLRITLQLTGKNDLPEISDLSYEYKEDDLDTDSVYYFIRRFEASRIPLVYASGSTYTFRVNLPGKVKESVGKYIVFQQKNEKFSSQEKIHKYIEEGLLEVKLDLGTALWWPVEPRLKLEGLPLSFCRGEHDRRDVLIQNSGTQDLEITRISIEGKNAASFAVKGAGDCDVLPPHKSCRFHVVYEPVNTDNARARLVIESNDPKRSRAERSITVEKCGYGKGGALFQLLLFGPPFL